MNNRCLYCYRELLEGQTDFHAECATDLFGGAEPILNESFTLKEASEGYTPELEALAMRLARAAVILTVPSSLVRDNEGRVVYAAKYNPEQQTIEQLATSLDGCEVDGSAEMIAELVEDFSSISRLDVVNFFEQLLFGWVMGCRTMNFASFALVRPNEGVCSLAPLFDVVPSFGGADEFALTINGKRRNIRRSDFEASMRYMGLKDRIIRIIIEKMTGAKELWLELISLSPLSTELKELFAAQVTTRLAALQGAKPNEKRQS